MADWWRVASRPDWRWRLAVAMVGTDVAVGGLLHLLWWAHAEAVSGVTALLVGALLARREGVRLAAWPVVAVAGLTVTLRGIVLLALTHGPHWPVPAALAVAALAWGAGAAALAGLRADPPLPWTRWAWAVAGYVVVFRIASAAAVDLLPEECYYWLYGMNLDIGYLDHPPMVGWLIALSTGVLGKDEWTVRLPALVCWLVTAGYATALARRLYDATTGLVVLVLLAVLPFYFMIGVVMTPDAPLTACWAAALYYLARVLLGGERRAWWGVGLALGLGMLSKYSIALLGGATLLFVLLHAPARHWLRRPEPYLAALLALVVFSPVLVWNFQHDWASFNFQGSRRWSGSFSFSLHKLLLAVVVLLTPLGAWAMARLGWSLLRRGRALLRPEADPRLLFALCYTAAPLAVFLLHSLRSPTKLNWTGPLWLAALPLLAWSLTQAAAARPAWLPARRTWLATGGATLLVLGAAIATLATSWVQPKSADQMALLPVAWEEVGRSFDQLEDQFEAELGERPLLVGMDKYFLASVVSFYDDAAWPGGQEVAGRHLLGRTSLMFERWFDPAHAAGRTLLLFDYDQSDVANPRLAGYFRSMGPVQELPILKHGRNFGTLYWRLGYGYQPKAM